MAFVMGFHKLSDILDTICSYIIVVMLGAMVVITSAQIVCRMAFTALSWSEEATRYLLVWSSFPNKSPRTASTACKSMNPHPTGMQR